MEYYWAGDTWDNGFLKMMQLEVDLGMAGKCGDHTIEHMMDEFFYPNPSVRLNFDIWEEKGRPDMLSRANELVQHILRECEECKEGVLDLDLIYKIKKTFPGIKNV